MGFSKCFYLCRSLDWIEDWRSRGEFSHSIKGLEERPRDPLGEALHAALEYEPGRHDCTQALSLWRLMGGYSACYFGLDSAQFPADLILGNPTLEHAFDRGSEFIAEVLIPRGAPWAEVAVYTKKFASMLLLTYLEIVDGGMLPKLGEISSLDREDLREASHGSFFVLGFDASMDHCDDFD